MKSPEVRNKDTQRNKIYVSVRIKFYISLITAILWFMLSVFLSRSWIRELASLTNAFVAIFIIGGIAYIPGFINAFLVCSLLLDKQPKFKNDNPDEEVTILVAAYNEESGIFNTLRYIKNQDYRGKINTIVINNNSKDNTVSEVYSAKKELNMNLTCID